MLNVINTADAESARDIERLRKKLHEEALVTAALPGGMTVEQAVAGILEQVRAGGNRAAAELTNRFDRAQVTEDTLRVSAADIEAAAGSIDESYLGILRGAIQNVRAYQEHIRHRTPPSLDHNGKSLGVRYTPIDRVAVYVPGGKALYPSSVIMTVVPAIVAGVQEIVMVSPPTGGDINPMTLALAHELGIKEVYRLGGAVGLAAVAYGTETIKPVKMIVGPGNAFVAEAKRQLFGKVKIDSIAGPSEVLIVADDTANPVAVAADILAQVEHAPGSAVLVCTSQALADAVVAEVDRQIEALSRKELFRASLQDYSAVIVCGSLDEACDIANDFATEHLQIVTENPDDCLDRITHAGAIFIGPWAPVPAGDYYAGPSHVLPTSGTAQFFSPLSCNDFLKSTSLIRYSREALHREARHIRDFALAEGLDAHAATISRRFDDL